MSPAYRSSLTALWLLSLCAGCEAYREPLVESVNVAAVPSPPPGLAKVNVRVRYPQAGTLSFPGRRFQVPQEILTWNSDHVIAALSATKLFASVAYAAEDDPPNVLLIRAVLPPAWPRCGGDMLILLTLGIFPAVCDRDDGVYFEFFDPGRPQFNCAWPQTKVFGWLPVLLVTGLGDWTRRADDQAFTAHLQQCVLTQASSFAALTNESSG